MARTSCQLFALAALATPGFAVESASSWAESGSGPPSPPTCPVGCVYTEADSSAAALGLNTNATGFGSLAAGRQTRSMGGWSVALGRGTEATGLGSLAVGGWTKAEGKYSLAGGRGTTASGAFSVAFGRNTHAVQTFEAVFEMNSETDCKDPVGDPCGSGSVFRIGAGTFGTGVRRDAFKVDPFGQIAIKGPLYPWCNRNATSTCDPDPIFDLHKELRQLRSHAAEVKADVDDLKGLKVGFVVGMTIMSLTIVALILNIYYMRRELKALRAKSALREPMLQNQPPSSGAPVN